MNSTAPTSSPRRTRVLIIGCGKRVLEAAIPAFQAAADSFEICGVLARNPRSLNVKGQTFDVRKLAETSSEELEAADLIYAAVAKPAGPSVLAKLAQTKPNSFDLLIDTPILLFKHMGHSHHFAHFRNTWVAEDCAYLPCVDPLKIAAESLGQPTQVQFNRSAYAYHGLAMGKALLGERFVSKARRHLLPESERNDGAKRERRVHFSSGRELIVREPRDYGAGRWRVSMGSGQGSTAIADGPLEASGAKHRLEPVLQGSKCTGFRIADWKCDLESAEVELIGTSEQLQGGSSNLEGLRVSPWMDGMKRVGFLRILRDIQTGKGGYPLDQGLDDTAVDYQLEKFGRYRVNPLTTVRFKSSQLMLRGLSKFAK